jgi:RNA polymerase sigma-70 factor (ECF subfamily)
MPGLSTGWRIPFFGTTTKRKTLHKKHFFAFGQHGKQLAEVQDQQAWLARIAWRVISRHWKKHRRETPIDDLALSIELSALEIGAEQKLSDHQERALLDRMVAALPADLREVLLLSTVEEMSSFRIAEMLRVPESTVRGRLLRARKVLRQKMERVIEGTK